MRSPSSSSAPGIIVALFSGDVSIQSFEIAMDDIPFLRAETAVILHAVNFAENPVQFSTETLFFLPREGALINPAVYPFMRLLNPGSYTPAPIFPIGIPQRYRTEQHQRTHHCE
jgi:hypothetical protein